MFTGLIKEIGTIVDVKENESGKIFTISCNDLINQIEVGDSIAINGVCLTIIAIKHHGFDVQSVHITLHKTNLGSLQRNSTMNMELAISATDRFGGHLVQGHINGIGHLADVNRLGENYEINILIPDHYTCYLIKEGSIAIDGISLTIADVIDTMIQVSIIPYTWTHTTLHTKKPGDSVNIEIDLVAKYVENLLKYRLSA